MVSKMKENGGDVNAKLARMLLAGDVGGTKTLLGMFDPDTGKYSFYPVPFRYTQPYECWADPEDNVWLDLGWGQKQHTGLARFNPRTEKFTFFPYPNPDDHNDKISIDPRGTFWLGSGGQLASFKPKGNVLTRRSGM